MTVALRTRSRWTSSPLAAGALLAAVVLLTGCSGGSGSASTGSDSSVGDDAAAETGADSSGTDADTSEADSAAEAPAALEPTDGCAWISADDAAAALGAPITVSGPTSGHLGAIDDCNYGTDPTIDAPYGMGITYQVIDHGSADAASSAFASMSSGGASAGVGDESAAVGAGGVIARFGSLTSAVLITGLADGVTPATALQQQIALHVG